MALATSEQEGAGAAAPKAALETAGIHMQLPSVPAAVSYPAGGVAFAQFDIANRSGAKYAKVELAFEADGANIRAIKGARLRKQVVGPTHVVQLSRLRRGRSQSVLVELKLNGAVAGMTERTAINRLRVTLRIPGRTDAQSATLAWRVADCARDFHAEIEGIRNANIQRMTAALTKARKGDPSISGQWIFSPPGVGRMVRAKRRTCVRSQRWQRRCVRYGTRTVMVRSRAVMAGTAEERKVFGMASTFLRTRGTDPQLRNSGAGAAWVLKRVAQDLRAYLGQSAHPALCTGVPQMMGYYDKKLLHFRTREAEIADLQAQAQALLTRYESQLRDALIEQSEGHPGVGGAPLRVLTKPNRTAARTLDEQIGDTLALAGEQAHLDDIKAIAGVRAKLTKVKQILADDGAAGLTDDGKKALANMFAVIEAAQYIGAVSDVYEALKASVGGSLAAIRQAHSKHCKCDG